MPVRFIPQLLPKDNLVVSLSMGIASLCVLHFIKNKLKRNVSAFHFNHNLRLQNEEMEENARHFCEVNNIPLIVGRADWKKSKNLNGSEANCRFQRLCFIIKYLDGSNLITGHHLDDSVESYLLNCFRGHTNYLPIPLKTILTNNNGEGLSEFTESVGSTNYKNKVEIYHPFLLTTKNDFWQYVCKNEILRHYICHDETNSDENIALRNWIRNKLVPIINEKECINLQTVVRKKIEEKVRILFKT